MEVPGHRRCPGGQEEGEGRGLPQEQDRGRQGQAGRAQGRQDRQEDRPLPEGHRVLRTLTRTPRLYTVPPEFHVYCTLYRDQLQLLK